MSKMIFCKLFGVFLLLGISVSMFSQSKIVDIQKFESLRKNPLMQKVDLRTGAEYEVIQGLEDFISINCVKKNFIPLAEKTLDKNKPLLVYCMSGHRSAEAVKQLNAAGFKEIYELKGGLIHYFTSSKGK